MNSPQNSKNLLQVLDIIAFFNVFVIQVGQGNIILLGSAHVQQRASILCCRHVGSYLMYQLKSCTKSNLIDFILSSHKAALIKSTHFSNLNSGVSSTLKWMEWTLTVLKTLCNRQARMGFKPRPLNLWPDRALPTTNLTVMIIYCYSIILWNYSFYSVCILFLNKHLFHI